MKSLRADLRRVEGMAFARVADCGELVRRFHGLGKAVRGHPDYPLLVKVYGWVFVPWSLWPVDVRGLGLHVVRCVEEGREVDGAARSMGGLLSEAPPEDECAMARRVW